MNIIKLDAIGSTNTFLKELVSTRPVPNYTVVSAESQYNGRGQMGLKWVDEKGKNLLFSVLVKGELLEKMSGVCLNYCVSLAVLTVLMRYNLTKLKIKWPNDILSESNKISGILIENSWKKDAIKDAIIGIGINVNQLTFDSDLKQVTSMKTILGSDIDKGQLLLQIVDALKNEIENYKAGSFDALKSRYLKVLYKIEIPTMFKDSEDLIFLGKIVNVSNSGKLQIELNDGTIREFGIKEIQMLKKL